MGCGVQDLRIDNAYSRSHVDIKPAVATKAEAIVEWDEQAVQNFTQEATPRCAHGLNATATLEHALIYQKTVSFSVPSRIFTAPSLELIPHTQRENLVVVLLNIREGWPNPIIGEVRYVKGRRYQFIGQPPQDEYGVIVGTDNFSAHVIHGSSFGFNLPEPWSEDQKRFLRKGYDGTIYEITQNNRQFVLKKHHSSTSLRKEITAYEMLHDVDGIGPYLGHISEALLLKKGEALENYAYWRPTFDVRFMRKLLKTIGAMHERSIFHNDIKISNFVMSDGIPHLIDFGSFSATMGEKNDCIGFTYPYYFCGEEIGIHADLRALGLVLFAIKHFFNPRFVDSFHARQSREIILKSELAVYKIAELLLENGDFIDGVIAGLILKRYRDAFHVLDVLR